MKRQLGVLLLIAIATVGLSSVVSAQPFDQGYGGGPSFGPQHGGNTIIIINRHRHFRHHFFPPFFFFRHRFFRHHFFHPFMRY